MKYIWHRWHPRGYECSSKGDQRFSALYAKIDGRSIEDIYQLDVKGYKMIGEYWKLGKGKPPLNGKSRETLWEEYKSLWVIYLWQNQELVEVLENNYILTDQFAKTEINQARALAEIMNEIFVTMPFKF